MNTVVAEDVKGLCGVHGGPCLSIYLPLERANPQGRSGGLHFVRLLEHAEQTLRQRYRGQSLEGMLWEAHRLGEDRDFWNQRLDGLAVFGGPGTFRSFDVPGVVPEKVVAGNQFHVRPLVRLTHALDRFQVLCLSRDRANLHEGSREALVQIAQVGLNAETGAGEEAFFEQVEREVLARVSRRAHLPLVLVATEEHQALFRGLSRNPNLLTERITADPVCLAAPQLCGQAWECVLPDFMDRVNRLNDNYSLARQRRLTCEDLDQVAQACRAGRVGTLLIEAGQFVRQVDVSQRGEDLFDALGEEVLRLRGNVVVVPGEHMPGNSGVAAILRY